MKVLCIAYFILKSKFMKNLICLVHRTAVDKEQLIPYAHLILYFLLIPVHEYTSLNSSGTGHSAVDVESTASAIIMWALGLAGASSEFPPPLCKTLVGKGASSLVGAFSRSCVLFDEQPEMKNVRAKGATKHCCQGAGCRW